MKNKSSKLSFLVDSLVGEVGIHLQCPQVNVIWLAYCKRVGFLHIVSRVEMSSQADSRFGCLSWTTSLVECEGVSYHSCVVDGRMTL